MPNVEGVLELYGVVFGQQASYKTLKEKVLEVLDNPNVRIFTVEEDVHYAIPPLVLSSITAMILPNLSGRGRDYMVIENVCTHPDYQGRGLAKRLFKEAEAWARERDCFKILVVSNKKFKVGKVYQSAGFEGGSSEVFIKHL